MKRQLIIGLSVLIGGFLLLDFLVMPFYVDHGATQKVPDVLAKTTSEARQMLESGGLEVVEAETKADDKAPPGTVIAQNPAAGAEVKSGRRIYLTISGGELMVGVPRLRGLSTRDARFALERAGLVLGGVIEAVSDTFFANTVIGQSPPAGGSVPKGSAVRITVSLGKDPGSITVPDLTGKTMGEAQKVLSAHGLIVGRVTYQSGMNLIPNTVIDQYPRGGDPVDEDRAVDLFVVRGGDGQDETHPEF